MKRFTLIVVNLLTVLIVSATDGSMFGPHNDIRMQQTQQGITITGTITDEYGESLPGVNIIIKGTTMGIASDANGRYIITVPNDRAVLQFRYISYISQEIEVGNRTVINVLMREDTHRMEELVVIGYGTTTKKEVTGSVSTIKSEDFKQGNIVNPMQLLQGQVAGLNIVRPSGGDPNANFQIQLRGLTTLSGGAQPLIVVDGVIGGSLNNISVEDIETIDVLKDGSAAAIYGTRGTNGVILVTTKRARPGSTSVEFSSYIAVQSVAKQLEVLSANDFRQVVRDFFPNQYGTFVYDESNETNWFKEITLANPISQYYNLSSSGGNPQLNYRANISWQDNQGLVQKSNNNRLRTRVNVIQRGINDRLTLNYNLSYSSANIDRPAYRALQQAARRNPTEPIYDTEGKTPVSGGFYYNAGPFDYHNPVALIDQYDDNSIDRNFFGSINATFQVFDALKVNMLASLIQSNVRRGRYTGKYYPGTFGTDGTARIENSLSLTELYEFMLDFNKNFGNHKVQAIAGYSWNGGENEYFDMQNSTFDTDKFSFYNIGSGAYLTQGRASMSSDKSMNTLIAFFGRIMYNYKEKYLFSTSVRYEGSSRFGANNKWGVFPAVSLGWRVTEEDFMKDVSWLKNFKLRTGYGVTGNQEIGNYQSLQILSRGSNSFWYNGQFINTYGPGRNPNPDLRWEKKSEFTVGAEFGLLVDWLNFTLEYYNRRTSDMLYRYPVPVPPYLFNTMFANVGTIDNNGFEATVNASPIRMKDFNWNLTFLFSRNKNKLVSFSNEHYPMIDIQTGYMGEDIKVNTMRIVEGGPIGDFWGPKFLGFTEDGDNLLEDVNGDGRIGTPDNQVIGNAYPDFTLSLYNSFTYKDFDISFLLRGSVGNDVLNMSRLYYEGFGYFGDKNILKSTLDYPEYKGGALYSSRFIEDGSYLKMDNLTVGYTLPVKNNVLSKVRLYISAQDLFTITKYKGIDPELALEGLEPGIDWFDYYPRTRTFVFGLNVNF